MPYKVDDKIVIAVSSTALFDLREESRVFEEQGLAAYQELQQVRESILPAPGTAFGLVKAVLNWNNYFDTVKVEVILASKNSPDNLRFHRALQHYGLKVSRAVFTSGNTLIPYLLRFNVALYLSTDEDDVKAALESNIAAGIVYPPPSQTFSELDGEQVRLAFDGDAVLVSDQAERVYQNEGIEAFYAHEKERAEEPLPPGPFTNFLRMVSELQEHFPADECPVRVGLFTTRDLIVFERMMRTLRHFRLRIDEALFLGGVEKAGFLAEFKPHIYFDDQTRHTDVAAPLVPTAQVPSTTQMTE